MNADPLVQQRLLDLAEVDAELVRIAHRRRNLPEAKRIDELTAQRQARKDAAVAVEIKLDDLDRDMNRLETELDSVRQREKRDGELMQSGTVAAKQLVELEHELGSLTRRRGVLEDDLLELMEQREAVEEDYKHAGAQLDAVESDLADAARLRDEALADLDVAERRCGETRGTLVPSFPADLVELYERARARTSIGAGLLRARRCGACRIEIDSSELSRIANAPADAVIRCDECGAILVRTAESGL